MKKEINIKEKKNSCGEYIAVKTFIDHNVVSRGIDPEKVFNEAKSKGIEAPVLIHVSNDNLTQIYQCL